MLELDCKEILLGIQEAEKIKAEKKEGKLYIRFQLKRKKHKCPSCGSLTDKIHDYRIQNIRDLRSFDTPVVLVYRRRRYVCTKCSKRFSEDHDFVGRRMQITKRMVSGVIERLREARTYTSVGKELGISVTQVIRIFDYIAYPNPQSLPEVIGIDEFKGNTGGEKYNCILTDPKNHRVIDILPKRYENYLTHYLCRYSKEERRNVKIFVSDMWKVYDGIADVWFKDATKVVDKYHWARQVTFAFERVRKDLQKKLPAKQRKYYKHSKRMLNKRSYLLKPDELEEIEYMLYNSPTLATAYYLKEKFQKMLDTEDPQIQKKLLNDWVLDAEGSEIKAFEDVAKTMHNWIHGIYNSLFVPYTNGFTEGCNNKIKVLKRNAYGFTRFDRFRNRVLHIFSDKNEKLA